MEGIQVERILKQILENYDNVISRRTHDIGNCQVIKYVIRLLNKILVIEK